MIISIITLNSSDTLLADKIKSSMKKHSVNIYCFKEDFDSIHDITEKLFYNSDAIIYFSACGIVVRAIAPYIQQKTCDPAIIVANNSFVISLLSGHIGGGNELCEIVADIIKATAVITTATDTAKMFSPDSFARANSLIISDMTIAKEIAVSVINGEEIGFMSDLPYVNIAKEVVEKSSGKIGIYIGDDNTIKPFEKTLHLKPRDIIVGIGCKKGTLYENIDSFVKKALENSGISLERVYKATSIDIKKNEEGLIQFSFQNKIPIEFYSAEKLMEQGGDFSSSEFVKSTTGADNVCERSIVCAGGKVIVKKACENGVTVAIGRINRSVDFNKRIW